MREPTTPEDTTFVVVERAAFASPHLDETSAARVSAQVTRLVTRAGAATSWPERHPTSAELRATRCRGLIIVPAIDELEITRTGAGSEITCAVSLRVAPWHGTDGGERWEAHTTAVATGSARTVTASSSRQIALGVRDCLDSAVEAVATRRLVPFLVVAARD